MSFFLLPLFNFLLLLVHYLYLRAFHWLQKTFIFRQTLRRHLSHHMIITRGHALHLLNSRQLALILSGCCANQRICPQDAKGRYCLFLKVASRGLVQSEASGADGGGVWLFEAGASRL